MTVSKLVRACNQTSEKSPEKVWNTPKEIPLKGLNILVAEDNPINQKLIGRVLEGMGINVTLAENGKTAAEIRMAQSFDAVLMDIQMPVMGGVESAHRMLNYEKVHNKPHVPIIALTANALQGDCERYIQEGFDNYVSKPVNLNQLRLVLQQHCIRSNANEVVDSLRGANVAKPFVLRTILMYSKSNGLIQRIHQDALSYAGHVFISKDDEESFFEALETQKPEYVLLDTYSIEMESCKILQRIQTTDTQLYLYGSLDSSWRCHTGAIHTYTSVGTLLKTLR